MELHLLCPHPFRKQQLPQLHQGICREPKHQVPFPDLWILNQRDMQLLEFRLNSTSQRSSHTMLFVVNI